MYVCVKKRNRERERESKTCACVEAREREGERAVTMHMFHSLIFPPHLPAEMCVCALML